jgi:hypothetical protein
MEQPGHAVMTEEATVVLQAIQTPTWAPLTPMDLEGGQIGHSGAPEALRTDPGVLLDEDERTMQYSRAMMLDSIRNMIVFDHRPE